MVMGAVCFELKKLMFVMQNLEIWGLLGTGGKNLSLKVSYLELPTSICLYSLCNFYMATIMIKGSLLLFTLISIFSRNNTKSKFGRYFDDFGG